MYLGGRENEHNVFGRLFQRLEKGVERLRRQHVHLVDDVDLVPSLQWRKLDLFEQVSDLVHAVVGRGVHLDYVHIGRLQKRPAGVALPARRTVGERMFAIDCAGENLRRRRLSGASRAGEKIGVRNRTLANLVGESADDVLLPDHRGKRIGAIFAIQRNVSHYLPVRIRSPRRGAFGNGIVC